jgi:plastocyanin
MRSACFTLGSMIVVVACSACGGGSTSTPVAPTPTGTNTINILGINGAQSFSPNPGAIGQGQTMVWQNKDPGNVHRIVADDGSFDAGTIMPGATSAPVPLRTSAVSYHCTNHPTMVGSINMSTPQPPGPGY